MPGWTLIETHPTEGHAFQRPLDAIELVSFWEAHFNGTTDILHPVELRLLNPSRDAHLFSDANVVKAWLSTKRRYPLAGATVQVLPVSGGGDIVPTSALEPHFIVREHDLAVLRPSEIVFGQVACAEEVQQRIADILCGPRPLSSALLVQLYIFRETNLQKADILHLMVLTAHCVTDGTANSTFMRCLLDTLARGGEPDSEPAQIPLGERLAMVTLAVDLVPIHLHPPSPVKRRWQRAIAAVIYRLRVAKDQGGHTLPRRFTHATPRTPARSGFVSTLLTGAQTSTMIGNCRLHELTFGNAYLVLAQVAMTRVLYRRYLRGEISEEEWAYRKRQPYRSTGPLSLRPYLDKAWFRKGGGGEFMFSVGKYSYKLPFMTLGGTERRQYHDHDLPDGAPPLSDLLTFDRFLHRAGVVKKQAKALFGHPLFFEIVRVTALERGRGTRLLALEWKKHLESANNIGTQGTSDDDGEVVAATDMPSVVAHGGSSFGNANLLCPTEYPLPPTHSLSPFSSIPHPSRAGYITPPPAMEVDVTPRIAVVNIMQRLHMRPAEIHLGALTLRGQLSMYVFYDRNVYENGVVREWLDEVRGAVLWYLGQTHRSGRDQRDHDVSDARQARL